MKKFLATTAVLLSATLVAPAFAENSVGVNTNTTVSTDTQVASSADLACMGTAVDAREVAVILARESFDTKIVVALKARRESLKVAFTIANNADRKVAIKTALNVFAKASVEARAQYRLDVKAAWKTFAEASKKCHVDADVRVKDESKDDHDKGRHLGQLKKQVKNGFGVNNHGKVDMDLSL